MCCLSTERSQPVRKAKTSPANKGERIASLSSVTPVAVCSNLVEASGDHASNLLPITKVLQPGEISSMLPERYLLHYRLVLCLFPQS